MPNTKLSHDRLHNHFHYNSWVYLVIFVASWIVVDIVLSVTAYRVPAERKVDIQLVGGYAMTDAMDEFEQVALSAGQAFDPTLEAVNFYSTPYSGENDMSGSQKLGVLLGAHEGQHLHGGLHSAAAAGSRRGIAAAGGLCVLGRAERGGHGAG